MAAESLADVIERWRAAMPQAPISPGTTAEAVAAVESRLDLRLPRDVVEFYLLANGWPFTDVMPELRPVESIGWFCEIESGWVEAWENAFDDPAADPTITVMKRSLLLSGQGEYAILLDPGSGDAAGEWTCFELSNDIPGLVNRKTLQDAVSFYFRSYQRTNDISSPAEREADRSALWKLAHGDRAAREEIVDLQLNSRLCRAVASQYDSLIRRSSCDARAGCSVC